MVSLREMFFDNFTGKKKRNKARLRSSEQVCVVDALAAGAEEGRGKLRKATGSRKQALNRGYPNGATRRGITPVTEH